MNKIKEIIAEDTLWKTFDELAQKAPDYLGNVPHICTNDYTTRDGVVLWTDHGVEHTTNVLKNILRLKPLIEDPLTSYEIFLLLAAGIVHDFGMFIRLIEGDLSTQRRFHGRLAQIILGNMITKKPDEEPSHLQIVDVWYIGILARLHQTKEFKDFVDQMEKLKMHDEKPDPTATGTVRLPRSRSHVTYSRLAQLGAILLLADGLDVVETRANHKIYKAFEHVLGQVNPLSSAEWLTNSLVKKYKIKVNVNSLIEAEYTINPARVNKNLQLDLKENDKEFKEDVARYFLSFLWRYLYDGHFREFKRVYLKSRFKVLVLDDIPKKRYVLREMENLPNGDRVQYNKEWQFWYEGLAHLSLGDDLWKSAMEKTLNVLGCDVCLVMVKDALRSVLRIFVPADFKENHAYGQYVRDLKLGAKEERDGELEFFKERFHEDCLRVRVPEKFSIAGHVWYRGLPEIIMFKPVKGGRMMSDDLDVALGLGGVFYYPVITKVDDDRIFHFLLVFNRRSSLKADQSEVLRNFCRSAWIAYLSDNDEPKLSDAITKRLDDLCRHLKDRLALGNPEVCEV